MEAIKELVKSTNGQEIGIIPPNPPGPDAVMRQVADLLTSLGYDGLGVVAIGPRGSAVNPLEFLPTGEWRFQVVPVKNGNV